MHRNIISVHSVKRSLISIVLMVFLFMIFNFLNYNVKYECKSYLLVLSKESSNQDQLNILSNTNLCKSHINDFQFNFNSSLEIKNDQLVKELEASVLWIVRSDLATMYPIISSINFWVHAIIFRTLPCILMLIFSILLINLMYKANLNKKRLIQQDKSSESDRNSEFNRTTTMLLIIIILFFIMEFPHGILYIICGFSNDFFINVYTYLADLLDVLVLINSSVNFFLYCFMSSEFTKKFRQTFFCESETVKTGKNITEVDNRLIRNINHV